MQGIIDFFTSDLGKMLIGGLVGLFLGGKNPALVAWILELLKIQKPVPKQPEIVQRVQEDAADDDVDFSEAIYSVANLRTYFDTQHPNCKEAHTALNVVWKHIGEVHVDKAA